MADIGSAVSELLHEHHCEVPLLKIGIPDAFIEHGKPAEQHEALGMDGAGVLRQVKQKLDQLGQVAARTGTE